MGGEMDYGDKRDKPIWWLFVLFFMLFFLILGAVRIINPQFFNALMRIADFLG